MEDSPAGGFWVSWHIRDSRKFMSFGTIEAVARANAAHAAVRWLVEESKND